MFSPSYEPIDFTMNLVAPADGNLFMWGRGFKGVADAHSPQRISSSLRFTKATLGWNHALALTGIFRAP